MSGAQEIQIIKLCDKLVTMSGYLKKQSDALSETALYLEKLSNDMANTAKSVQEILKSQNLLTDLPLEFL